MKNSKPQIIIFSSSLAGGGAERHILRLLPELQKKYAVTLALARREGELIDAVPGGVDLVEVGGKRALKAVFPLVKLISEIKPVCVLAVQDHAAVAALVAVKLCGLSNKPKFIALVQVDVLSQRKLSSSIKSRFLFYLSPHLLAASAALIGCSQGVVAGLVKANPYLAGKVHCIYNAAVDAELMRMKDEECPEPWFQDLEIPVIVGCGRLVKQKNFNLLLEAFAAMHNQQGCRLLIIGSGPERDCLETRARKLGVSADFKIVSFTNNPYCYFKRASVFVLSSLWEGFGNVIAEAMACGVPVVATDCPSGPSEIIEDGISGLLVKNASSEELSAAIRRVLEDKALARGLATGGQKRASQFSAEKSAAEYEKVIEA